MAQRSYKNQHLNFKTSELVQRWDEYDNKWVNASKPLGERAVIQYALRLERLIGQEKVRIVNRKYNPEFFWQLGFPLMFVFEINV